MFKQDTNGIRTASGAIVTATEGVPTLLDISQSLSRLDRWQGHLCHPWPVALHALVVGDLLPKGERIHGYLHDAAEAVIGDVAAPFKPMDLRWTERAILQRIYESLHVSWPDKDTDLDQRVHEADMAAREAEFTLWHPLNSDRTYDPKCLASSCCIQYEQEVWSSLDQDRAEWQGLTPLAYDYEKVQYMWLDTVERELRELRSMRRRRKKAA